MVPKVKLVLNNELKSTSKEAIVSYFERLSYLNEGTRVKHKISEVMILDVPGEFWKFKSLPTDWKSEQL